MKNKFLLLKLFTLGWYQLFAQTTTFTPQTITSRQNTSENSFTFKGDNTHELIGIRHGGTLASPTATPLGAKLLAIEGAGHTGLEFVSSRAAINMVSTEAWSPTANGTGIEFFTTPNGSNTRVRRMFIHGVNMAIGNHIPEAKFHVQDGSSGVTVANNTVGFFEKNGNNYIQMGAPDTSSQGVLFSRPTGGSMSGSIIYTPTNDMQFNTESGNTRMTISNTGNVGVGTGIPAHKLSVAGSFAFSGKTSLTGVQHNFALAGKSVIYVNGPSASLSGIAGGVEGQIVYVYFDDTTSFTLQHLSTSSATVNRIDTSSGANFIVTSGGGLILMYDSAEQVWRVIGFKS